jgi:hypothetical protein
VNLQVDEQAEAEAEEVEVEVEVQSAALKLPEKPLTTFAKTSAAIRELDLVISFDTAVVNLAGALGHQVWIATARAQLALYDRALGFTAVPFAYSANRHRAIGNRS